MLKNLRHSDGYDSEDYAYTSESLAKTAKEYLYDEYDTSFTLEEFVKYHSDDGDDVNQQQITLTKEQAKIIEKNIINGNFGGPLYCAKAVSEVLIVNGLDETYRFPLALEYVVKEIEMSKYNAKK